MRSPCHWYKDFWQRSWSHCINIIISKIVFTSTQHNDTCFEKANSSAAPCSLNSLQCLHHNKYLNYIVYEHSTTTAIGVAIYFKWREIQNSEAFSTSSETVFYHTTKIQIKIIVMYLFTKKYFWLYQVSEISNFEYECSDSLYFFCIKNVTKIIIKLKIFLRK